MNDEEFDSFLQEATLGVHDEWQKAGGRELSEHELYALNDLLTAYFSELKLRPEPQ